MIVSVLLVWSTVYELVLISRAKKAMKKKCHVKEDIVTDSSSGIGCTTYDLTSSVPNKGDLPIGIVIPRGMNNNNSDENLAMESINVEEIKLSESLKFAYLTKRVLNVSFQVYLLSCCCPSRW